MTQITQINEHPVLFSTPMVQAILEGRKTMTRRIVKGIKASDEIKGTVNFPSDSLHPGFRAYFTDSATNKEIRRKCPHGQPGDLLWVREKFSFLEGKFEPEDTYSYFADNFHWSFARGESPNGKTKIQWHDPDLCEELKWKSSIHMPKAAARIWLKITSIKVELLQDISEEDALKEGVSFIDTMSGRYFKNYNSRKISFPFTTAKESFESLWIKINSRESWKANPWVWAIEFEILSTTGKPFPND